MFDFPYRSKIKTVGVYVNDKGPIVLRRCTVALEREFDTDIANGIGPTAVAARRSLGALEMKSCVLPIDAVEAKAVLRGIDSSVTIEKCKGEQVKGKSGHVDKESGESDPPTVTLEFDFPFTDEVWAFLGKNAGAYIDIELTKNQLELPLDDISRDAAKDFLAAVPKGTTVSVSMDGEKIAEFHGHAEDIAEEQLADTPEEAERMREQRLGRNPAADGPTEGPDGKLAW